MTNVLDKYQEWLFENEIATRPRKVLPDKSAQNAVYFEQIKRDFEKGIPAIVHKGTGWTWGGEYYSRGDLFGPTDDDISALVFADLLRPGSGADQAKYHESAADYDRTTLKPIKRLMETDKRNLDELKAQKVSLERKLKDIETAISDKEQHIKDHARDLEEAIKKWDEIQATLPRVA